MSKRIQGHRVGVLRYNPNRGFSYVKVWVATPGQRQSAVRGGFPTVEAARADLRAIS